MAVQVVEEAEAAIRLLLMRAQPQVKARAQARELLMQGGGMSKN